MSWQEVAGAILGLINIVLLMRRSVWNFPVAMIMVTLVGVVLLRSRLYAEAALQVFFFVVNGYGWWLWRRVQGADSAVPVAWMDRRSRVLWLAATGLCSVSLGWLMHRFTNAALPFTDSAIAGASITAQFLLSYRKIENWVLWVLIDVASVCLYFTRELYLFAALYVAFGVLSAMGLREWVQSAREPVRA